MTSLNIIAPEDLIIKSPSVYVGTLPGDISNTTIQITAKGIRKNLMGDLGTLTSCNNLNPEEILGLNIAKDRNKNAYWIPKGTLLVRKVNLRDRINHFVPVLTINQEDDIYYESSDKSPIITSVDFNKCEIYNLPLAYIERNVFNGIGYVNNPKGPNKSLAKVSIKNVEMRNLGSVIKKLKIIHLAKKSIVAQIE